LIWAANRPAPESRVLSALALAVIAAVALTIGPNIVKLDAPAALTEESTWQPWSEQRVQTELSAGKPVFLDFTAAWCITCQYNKKTTLSNPQVLSDFASHNVRLLRADWTRRDPAITQALQNLGRSGVPVYVLYQAGKPPKVLSEVLTVDELRGALSGV
jgi:thiol:disulfide interchange protein DsbD